MARPKPHVKPTLAQLHDELGIDWVTLNEMDAMAQRLQQIQAQIKLLEAERGYTDSYTGERHPGISDSLETLLITHDLTEHGFRLENGASVIMIPGGASRIDDHLLLAEGVDPEVIKRCTVSKSWVTLQVRAGGKGEKGDKGDKGA